MAVSMEQFIAELKAFEAKKAVINEIRKDLRKPLPELRSAVRDSARETLPASGGLGAWIARASMSVRFTSAGRTAGVRIKLSRKSGKGKADLVGADAGKIRHPLYGNRRYWYPQSVTPGFFTRVWEESAPRWYKVADDAFDRALEVIRRG